MGSESEQSSTDAKHPKDQGIAGAHCSGRGRAQHTLTEGKNVIISHYCTGYTTIRHYHPFKGGRIVKVRRVVTGQDATGKSIFVSDEHVEPITLTPVPGLKFYPLWSADETPQLPSARTHSAQSRYFPPTGGFRWLICALPQESVNVLKACDVQALRDEAANKLPGLIDVLEDDHPGMHTTDTIDVGVILSGQVTLELDDEAVVTLGPGDTFVQNGTRHAWHNRGDVPVVICFSLIGAHRTAHAAGKPT
ncbi:MAG TPA: cupin domain-containing protein [Pseudonocardiaceae bacterium]|nr:cupin domain-containing protein [Pseudonocardiaceae bacterium]